MLGLRLRAFQDCWLLELIVGVDASFDLLLDGLNGPSWQLRPVLFVVVLELIGNGFWCVFKQIERKLYV